MKKLLTVDAGHACESGAVWAFLLTISRIPGILAVLWGVLVWVRV